MKSPDQISGLLGWWHADAVTTSGSTITAATDQSGNGRDLIGSGTPTLTSRAMVFTTASSDFLYRADALGLSGNPAYTIAYRAGNSGSATRHMHIGRDGVASGTTTMFAPDTSTRHTNGAKQWFSDPVPSSGFGNHIFTHATGGDYNSPQLYVDGSLATPTSAGSTNTTNWANESFMIGGAGGHTSPTFFTQASFREVAVFSRVLTADEIAQLDAYLASELMQSIGESAIKSSMPGAIGSAIQSIF